jgi:hypothetical protein
MIVFARIGTALAIASLTVTAAAAQTAFKKYGSEAGWEILINETTKGCLIAQGVGGETQVQMGINPAAEQRGYLAIYTKRDAAVAAGEKLSVLFDVDGEQFSGQATGQQMEGFDGAYVPVNNPQFIYDLAMKKTLTITPKGRDPIVLSLAGTDAAFKALRTCQEAQ